MTLLGEPPPPWARERVAPGKGATRSEQLADEILARCRGEGPPNCIARCPLGVDVRGYVGLAREGRFAEALQRVRERLPFPGILGYLCTHPCESHCKRIEQDAAVRVRDIKRFLAEWEPGEPAHLTAREPDRHVPVAVVGGGPAGLLAAHDLRRCGYDVTLLEGSERLGGCLVAAIPEWRLPTGVVDRDLSVLAALGVQVRTGVALGRDVAIDDLLARHCAVVLAVGFAAGVELAAGTRPPLRTSTRGTLWANPVTHETGVPGLFAAGDAVSGPSTVIDALASGRGAAESVHRYLTGAPERPDRVPVQPERLLWQLSISEDERVAREHRPLLLRRPPRPMTPSEAREEAGRCLDCHCDACVRECDFLASNCRSPRELARRVRDDPDEARTMVYSCTLCSLCAEVCPERLDTGAMLLEARRDLVRRGRGPLRAHGPLLTSYWAATSPALSLVMPEPGRRRSRRLFFPGCSLPALSPRQAVAMYDVVRRHFSGTGVLLHCCGAPVDALGMVEEAAQAREALLRHAESVGATELIVACPSCSAALRASDLGLKITSVWEALAGCWQPPRNAEGARLAVHDACRARHDSHLQDAVRLLARLAGAEIEEPAGTRERTRCCGFGGAIYPVAPELSRRIADRRIAESKAPFVSACSGCRTALASRGKDAVHLWDVMMSPDWPSLAAARPKAGLAGYASRVRAKLAFKRLAPLQSGD